MSIRLSLGSARAAAAGAAHIGSSFAASPDLQTDNDDNDEATATATGAAAAAAAATTVTATIVEPVGPENLVVGKTVSSVVFVCSSLLAINTLAMSRKRFNYVFVLDIEPATDDDEQPRDQVTIDRSNERQSSIEQR